MKKIFIMFLIVLSLMLIGCSNIYQHIHITCQECGKCIAEDCNGLEEDKCQGHQIVHTHIECEECGKCIDPECDGTSEEKCMGHAPKHEHVVCPECGKCITEDCDGLEAEKCQGHQVIHEHTECQECGKCIAEDCDGLEEEKCQGCIIVNLVDKTYVSYLWEDDPSKGQESIIINTFEEYISFVNKYCLMGFEYGETCGLHYEDHYYSIINEYDENYFEQNSLIFIYVGFLHSRVNPQIVHKVDYVDNELIVYSSVTIDSFSKDFRAGLFFNTEVSKYVIENYQNIKYIGSKIIILD